MSSAAATSKMKRLLFVETDTICRFFDDKPILTGAFAKEKNKVLAELPASYREKFNTVGFSSSSEGAVRSRPVQILSPYAVEPGPLRRVWVEAFLERQGGDRDSAGASSAENKFDDMPYLVYWFDKHDDDSTKESCITLVPPNEIISYEEGVRFGYHKIVAAAEEATPVCGEQENPHLHHQRNVKALELLAEARHQKKPCFTVKPDDELFTLVPRSMKPAVRTETPQQQHQPAPPNDDFITIGARLSVYCSVSKTHHEGVLCEQRGDFSLISFVNDEQKWIPLRDYSHKILPGEERPSSAVQTSPLPLLSYRCVGVDLQSKHPSKQLALPASVSRGGLDPSTTITPTTTTQPNPTVGTKTTPFALHTDNKLHSVAEPPEISLNNSSEQKAAISQPESHPQKQTNQAGSLATANHTPKTIQKSGCKAKKKTSRAQKKPKDYPKQALSAYNYYASEEHGRIRKLISGKDLDMVVNDPDSQDYVSQEQIRLATKENGKTIDTEVTKLVAVNWKKLDGDLIRMTRYNKMAAADKIRFRKELQVYNAKKRNQSNDDPTTETNKRQKTEAKANEVATKKTTNGSTGSAETNKCPPTKGVATTTNNPGITKTAATEPRSQLQSPAARNSNRSVMADDIRNYRKLKIALLQSLESLPPDSDPNATEQHREFLESLLAITFTDVARNSGIRQRVKQLRKNPKLCSLSNQVLAFWNLDLETQHWKDALFNQNLYAVVDKVKSITQYLQKNQCVCNDLVERVGLRLLITDTENFYAKRGENDENKFFHALKTIVDGVVN